MAELPIAQIRNCLLVADERSFHAAAGKAFRSQPAVTKSIQALEARLGGALFEATQRTVLTPFGQACLPYFRELLAHHDRTYATLSALLRKDHGVLTIASIVALAGNWLPALVRDFLADFPGVQVRLLDDNSQNVERMVLNHEVDFGLGSRISTVPELAFEPLAEDAFGVVCSPMHPLAKRKSLRWAELEKVPVIGTIAHRQLEGTPESLWLSKPFIQIATMLTLLSMLREGVGVTVLGRLAVPELAREGLVFVPLVQPARSRVVGIIKLAGQTPSPAAEEMLKRLRARASRSSPAP